MSDNTELTKALEQSTPTKRLSVNALVSGISLCFNLLTMYLTTPLLVKGLGVERYGIWALVIAVVGVAGVLDLGLTPSITYFVACYRGMGDREHARQVLSAAQSILLTTGLAFLLATVFFRESLAGVFNIPDEAHDAFYRLLPWIGGAGACMLFRQSFLALLQGCEEYIVLGLISPSMTVLRCTGIILILHFSGDLLELSQFWLAYTAIEMIVYMVMARRFCDVFSVVPFRASWKVCHELFVYGVPIALNTLASLLRHRAGNFLVSVVIGAAAVGLYNIPAIIAGYYMSLVSVPMGVLLPRFSFYVGRGDRELLRSLFFRVSRFNSLIAALIGLPIMLMGTTFLQCWLNGKFPPEDLALAGRILMLMTGAYVIALSQASALNLLYSIGASKYVLALNLIEGCIIIPSGYVLAKHYGIFGVALSISLVIFISKMFLQPWIVIRLLKLRFQDYYLPCLLKPWVAFLAAFVLLWWLYNHLSLPINYFTVFSGALVSAAVVFVIGWAFVLSTVDRRQVKRVLRPNCESCW